MTRTTSDARDRTFVLGPEKVRATILTAGAETGGRHDLTDSVLPAGSMTPLHLHTKYEERLFVVSGLLTVRAGQEELGPGRRGARPPPDRRVARLLRSSSDSGFR
jgi:hypothetical protein